MPSNTSKSKQIPQNQTIEWSFRSAKKRKDPFNEIELSVEFQGADGEKRTVPAFWAGDRNWRVRFSSPVIGAYHFRTTCSDVTDEGLHGQEGEFKVVRYSGKNPLYRHGAVRVAGDRRHFEHADGTPFFWLGDTWWMGLCKRMNFPKGFDTLAADRVKKGFTVVQIVAGLYPDMPAFDTRGANEAGYPWDKKYQRINPAYFDKADRRIEKLVDSGLVPCIVACWGYFLPWMGVEKMQQHWRNLVARYGSCPVFWCLAGEGTMPYYLSANKEADAEFQKKGWTELARYVRQIDGHRRPLSIHPSSSGRLCVEDPAVLDFDMIQTGHSDRASFPNTVKQANVSYRATPMMPVVESEVCYEGIGGFCGADVQRLMFWSCLLNGAAGFTYAANGIWQVNSRARMYGPSPYGMSWGGLPWEDAYQLPGSRQLGLAKQLLKRYPWPQIEPHPEWVEPRWTDDLEDQPYTSGRHDVAFAAGIPHQLRIIYAPAGTFLRAVTGLEPGVKYQTRLFNPLTGEVQKWREAQADADGKWGLIAPGTWFPFPIYQDFVLVMEAKS